MSFSSSFIMSLKDFENMLKFSLKLADVLQKNVQIL